jgi:hypothetical protein
MPIDSILPGPGIFDVPTIVPLEFNRSNFMSAAMRGSNSVGCAPFSPTM